MTITEFLLARINEDEAVARAAIDPDRPGTHWQWSVPDDVGDPDAQRWLRTTEEFPTRSGVGPLPAFPLGHEFKAEPARGMAHIARHDPARVLAECEAKRRAIDAAWSDHVRIEGEWGMGQSRDAMDIKDDVPEVVVALASVYITHPDYRDEWRA